MALLAYFVRICRLHEENSKSGRQRARAVGGAARFNPGCPRARFGRREPARGSCPAGREGHSVALGALRVGRRCLTAAVETALSVLRDGLGGTS